MKTLFAKTIISSSNQEVKVEAEVEVDVESDILHNKIKNKNDKKGRSIIDFPFTAHKTNQFCNIRVTFVDKKPFLIHKTHLTKDWERERAEPKLENENSR